MTPYDAALRTGGPCWVRGSDGARHPLPLRRWLADADADDIAMLDACAGATLDLGCGPGRLTVAQAARGYVALGVDISSEAVRITRARGGAALCRDLFDDLPGERRWQHALLADGNIGIGGDPVALLRRVRDLLAPGGTVVVEVDPYGTGLRRLMLRLEGPGSRVVDFRWARVGADAVVDVATAAGLTLHGLRMLGRRRVAMLRRRA